MLIHTHTYNYTHVYILSLELLYDSVCMLMTDCENCLAHYLQNVSISFINNTASIAGAAFYARSVSECTWLDTLTGNNITTILQQQGTFSLK